MLLVVFVEMALTILLTVTEILLLAGSRAFNIFVTNITEFEVAIQLGVPMLDARIVVTLAVHTPLLI
jgi:hypothetical protein